MEFWDEAVYEWNEEVNGGGRKLARVVRILVWGCDVVFSSLQWYSFRFVVGAVDSIMGYLPFS